MTKQKTKRQLKQNPSVPTFVVTVPLKKGSSLKTLEKQMEEIMKILRKRNWTIGVMESCTGGAVANCITNIPGASDVFECGLVTYCNEAKIKAGVAKKMIEKYGVTSKEVAEEMARKVDPPKAGAHLHPDKSGSVCGQAFRRAGVGVGVTGNLPGEVFVAVRVGDKVESIKLKVESKNKDMVEARKEMKKEVVGKVMEMIIENI